MSYFYESMTGRIEGTEPEICSPVSSGRRGKKILRKAETGLRTVGVPPPERSGGGGGRPDAS